MYGMMWPLQVVSVAALLSYLFYPAWSGQASASASLGCRARVNGRELLRDPVFWFLGLFVLYLSLAWLNAGRERLIDYDKGAWVFAPPRYAWLPWSIESVEAREIFFWFFPLFTLVMLLRHGIQSKRLHLALFRFCVWNACLLAVFGLIQKVVGIKAIYGIFPMERPFFATFGYANHSGDFFTLALVCSAGVLLFQLRQGGGQIFRNRNIGPLLAVVLCFVGANGGACRVTMVYSVVIVVILCGLVMRNHLAELMTRDRVMLVGFLALLFSICVLVVFAFGQDFFRSEVGRLFNPKLDYEYSSRAYLSVAAAQMFMDFPWYGVGPWGYRYFLTDYIDASYFPGYGLANVHNDALQFLVEFGAVGFSLLALALLVLIADWIKKVYEVRKKDIPGTGLQIMVITGLILVVGHSMIDLPFRSPAILYYWAGLLTGLPKLAPIV